MNLNSCGPFTCKWARWIAYVFLAGAVCAALSLMGAFYYYADYSDVRGKRPHVEFQAWENERFQVLLDFKGLDSQVAYFEVMAHSKNKASDYLWLKTKTNEFRLTLNQSRLVAFNFSTNPRTSLYNYPLDEYYTHFDMQVMLERSKLYIPFGLQFRKFDDEFSVVVTSFSTGLKSPQYFSMQLRRSFATFIVCTVFLMVMWILAVSIFYIAIFNRQALVSQTILLACSLALSTLRNSLPNVPEEEILIDIWLFSCQKMLVLLYASMVLSWAYRMVFVGSQPLESSQPPSKH
ncbi:hypothetical protein DSO57_1035055 [Entomophthora muscae]|uniref:Uncharacterized protein n=1 Tax=Entomophthora muscae TaxID=34485 RepID=A0ACC2REE0_9FUNG|nr:hypothetical protein DSO57_1035055 [Entomophthora muscae]